MTDEKLLVAQGWAIGAQHVAPPTYEMWLLWLFGAEGLHRIDRGGAPRGKRARNRRDKEQD